MYLGNYWVTGMTMSGCVCSWGFFWFFTCYDLFSFSPLFLMTPFLAHLSSFFFSWLDSSGLCISPTIPSTIVPILICFQNPVCSKANLGDLKSLSSLDNVGKGYAHYFRCFSPLDCVSWVVFALTSLLSQTGWGSMTLEEVVMEWEEVAGWTAGEG